MKKIIALLLFITIALSLVACDKTGQGNPESDFLDKANNFDISETKEIVLGKEVSSVDLTTKTGEKITFDNRADFYEIYDKVGFAYEVGKKYSCSAETTWFDQSKSFINMNIYHLDNARFYEIRTKKEGDDSIAFGEEYSYSKRLENNKAETGDFTIHVYKDEKAFVGHENGEAGNVWYSTPLYPVVPDLSTELGEMWLRLDRLQTTLLCTDFFKYYEPYETDNGTFDFNELTNREYKLYENYIVFKQTAPFLNYSNVFGTDSYVAYMSFLNSDCSITQEAYCNVKTGEIELIKVYGDTLWHIGECWGRELIIDMQMYIHDIDEGEEDKVDDLINYIKSNTTAE